MKEEMGKSRKAGNCQTNRFKKILLKHTQKKYRQKLREESSILSNFESKTNQYLKERIQ